MDSYRFSPAFPKEPITTTVNEEVRYSESMLLQQEKVLSIFIFYGLQPSIAS